MSSAPVPGGFCSRARAGRVADRLALLIGGAWGSRPLLHYGEGSHPRRIRERPAGRPGGGPRPRHKRHRPRGDRPVPSAPVSVTRAAVTAREPRPRVPNRNRRTYNPGTENLRTTNLRTSNPDPDPPLNPRTLTLKPEPRTPAATAQHRRPVHRAWWWSRVLPRERITCGNLRGKTPITLAAVDAVSTRASGTGRLPPGPRRCGLSPDRNRNARRRAVGDFVRHCWYSRMGRSTKVSRWRRGERAARWSSTPQDRLPEVLNDQSYAAHSWP